MHAYLEASGALAVLHAPETPPTGLAVLLLPPFGWEETCSYRSRREWAQRLAADGHAALRVDLPATGDSAGSPRDPALLDAWTAAIHEAAGWLDARTHARRVVAVGLGLGGLLACRAWASEAPVDDLVLWGVPARGRSLIRELRAFARLDAGGDDHEGALHAGGHHVSPQTLADLEALDLTNLEPPRRSARALLLERDGIAPDRRLAGWLEAADVEVQTAPGPGWSGMTAHPHEARPPHEVYDTVAAWLEGNRAARPVRPVRAVPRASARLDVDGGRVREAPVVLDRPCGKLPGILAEPAAGPATGLCALFLNPGAIRRTGPNRMWVEAARRWAARGVPSVRLDLEGLGDADGDATGYYDRAALNVPELTAHVRAALDLLEARGTGERFVVVGLCSGAYHAFHAALEDPRVAAAFMVNPGALFWEDSIESSRHARKVALLLRPRGWLKLLRGDLSPARALAVLRWLAEAPLRLLGRRRARGGDGDNQVTWALDRLRDTGKRVLLAFADEEPLRRELDANGVLDGIAERWPNVDLEHIEGSVHTLRPAAMQRRAHALLDEALDRELARVAPLSRSAAPRSAARPRPA